MYAQVFLMIGMLVAKRKLIDMQWNVVIQIAFQSLICLPDAINLYRKASAYALNPATSVLDVGQALLSREDLSDFYRMLAASADEQLNWAVIESSETRRLTEFRKSIEKQARDNA